MSADDVFVSFVENARRMLYESFQKELYESTQARGPSWNWVCTRILISCKAYPRGVTSAILLSDLYESWMDRVRMDRFIKPKGTNGLDSRNSDAYRLRKQKQLQGTKVTTIDSILEKELVSLEAVLDVIILDIQLLPGTTTYLLTLGDAWSLNTIEMYLHNKFFDLVDSTQGILRQSREIRITGCRLRNSVRWTAGPPRLLPTELIIILLDEEEDDDLVLLGAKFCNDYFSSIQLTNIKAGIDYHFYARVEEIEPMRPRGQQEQIQQHRITLRDDNGDVLPFLLWNDQVLLSNMLSKGSMVAIERPSIVYELESDNCTVSGLWFEYESQTRLYAVQYVPLPEQATLEASQGQLLAAGLSNHESMENDKRILIENVQSIMPHVALYGLVTHLSRIPDTNLVIKQTLGAYKSAYVLRIGDNTGVLDINLYFNDQWSAGDIHVGQMVFISGFETSVGVNGGYVHPKVSPALFHVPVGPEHDTCPSTKVRLPNVYTFFNLLECTWTEKQGGVSLVNMTQLSALLSTSCLHRIVPLSKISSSSPSVQVKYCHICCGRPVIGQPNPSLWRCNFCGCMCDSKETVLTFFLTALLVDTYPGEKTQVYATCSGQAAREIMQAEPKDFCSWSEMDQGMYLYGLENEQFKVILYSGLQDDMSTFQIDGGSNAGAAGTCLRVGQALKANPD